MNGNFSDVTMIFNTPEMISKSDKAKTGPSYLLTIYGDNLGKRYTIEEKPIFLGRSSECEIQLDDDSVSRKHCKVVPEKEVVVFDLKSTNGTFVNSSSVSTRNLVDGDALQVGRTIFKFLSGDNIEHAYHEEIYRLKTTDGLTGAFNKRTFDEEIKREFFRFRRHDRPLCLLLLDIDFFKKVNDTHGHLAGDMVLAQLSKVVSANVRSEDLFCRYGGEEFAILMPETSGNVAIEIAERLRKRIEETAMVFDGTIIPITVSIGVAIADKSLNNTDDFIAVSDANLYAAKEAGRNQVISEKK